MIHTLPELIIATVAFLGAMSCVIVLLSKLRQIAAALPLIPAPSCAIVASCVALVFAVFVGGAVFEAVQIISYRPVQPQ